VLDGHGYLSAGVDVRADQRVCRLADSEDAVELVRLALERVAIAELLRYAVSAASGHRSLHVLEKGHFRLLRRWHGDTPARRAFAQSQISLD
jgi:hypothetical protein